jgi:hypothetical protein
VLNPAAHSAQNRPIIDLLDLGGILEEKTATGRELRPTHKYLCSHDDPCMERREETKDDARLLWDV